MPNASWLLDVPYPTPRLITLMFSACRYRNLAYLAKQTGLGNLPTQLISFSVTINPQCKREKAVFLFYILYYK